MTAAARLIGAVLSAQPGNPEFIARLTDSGGCDCAIDLDDALAAGFAEVRLRIQAGQISAKYVGLVHTTRYLNEDQVYRINFRLPNTTVPEGAKVIKQLFGEDLATQYWYQLASSTMLCAKLDQASRRVTFLLLPSNPDSNPENWQKFAERLLSASDRCGEIHAAADRVSVVITAESWEKWEEVVPQLAALFPA